MLRQDMTVDSRGGHQSTQFRKRPGGRDFRLRTPVSCRPDHSALAVCGSHSQRADTWAWLHPVRLLPQAEGAAPRVPGLLQRFPSHVVTAGWSSSTQALELRGLAVSSISWEDDSCRTQKMACWRPA